MAVAEHRATVMACRLQVIVNGPRCSRQPAEAQVFLGHLEAAWSRFVPSSDISRINSQAPASVAVSPDTIMLVDRMRGAWEMTQGRYDPTILPALVANGYAASKADPSRRTILPTGPHRIGAMGDVSIDHASSTISAPAGVSLDPGGIGKGLAADLAVAMLLDGGAAGALVSIGGDLAAAGQPADALGWPVDVEHPDPNRHPICEVLVDSGGVATSSTRSRRWIEGGRVRHHLINPFTGEEAQTDLATVTVFAADAWRAEAHATAALLGSADSVVGYLDSHDLTGLAVASDGAVLRTGDLKGLKLSLPELAP